MAFYFVSTFAIAQTPIKQPALRLSRTKNLHFAKAPFPGFSAKDAINERDLTFALKGRSHDVIALVRYVKEQGLYDPVADGLRSAFEYDKTYFDKIVASLLPLMEKLISGKVAELISPDYSDTDDTRPIIDWRQIIRRKGIVYIGLDALSDMAVASAVGNSMFADLVSVSGEIYKHGTDLGLPAADKTEKMPTISLHADEFNELIGDEFIPLLNKAGGAGFQVTAYTQTWSDVEARLGSACTKKPFLENTLLYLTEYFLNFDSALQKTHQLLRVF